MNDPAARFTRVHVNDVFALTGASSVSYGTKDPALVKIAFETPEHARIAKGVLKDTVLGAKLLFTDKAGTPIDFATAPNPEWTHTAANFARGVSAMPGVVSHRWMGQSILFTTDSIETRVRLQQLVTRNADGVTQMLWKGECFGPGCPPDPKAPDGSIPEASKH